MRCVCILIVLVVLLAYAMALEEKSSSSLLSSSRQTGIVDGNNNDYDDNDDEDDDYDYSVQDKKGHIKHKHKNKLFLSRNAGFSTVHVNPFAGSLKSLVAFIAIKIKIILVVVTVIGIIGFTLKVFGALKYGGYIGGSDCPVIHEPAYSSGYSATPPVEHVQDYPPYGANNDWSKTGSYARSIVEKYIDTDIFNHALKNMDMAEMIFSTLEMEDEKCRRRLVCEIDAKTRQIPYFSYIMDFFSHGFEKYRTAGEKTKYKECAKLYPECEDEKESRKRRKKRTVK